MPVLDARGQQAVDLVIADEWKFFRDRDRRPSWSLPSMSKPGLYYRVTEDGCTCPDLKYRPWVACKHMLAVRLQNEIDEEQYAF